MIRYPAPPAAPAPRRRKRVRRNPDENTTPVHGELRIMVSGTPHFQGRPRARAFRVGGKIRAQIYNPSKSSKWQKQARTQMILACQYLGLKMPVFPATQLLQLRLEMIFSVPKKEHRKTEKLRPRRRWYNGSGDFDNCAKPLCDAANGVLWNDDRQVVDASVAMIYGAQGEPPCTRVFVEPARPEVVDLFGPSTTNDTFNQLISFEETP